MTIRVLITSAFGLSAVLAGGDANVGLSTNRVEACGVKVAVKAAPPKRNLRRRARRQPIKRGGSRVAVRTKVNSKSARKPIATGPDRQARTAKRSVKRAASRPSLRVSKRADTTPKSEPAPKKVVPKAEPKRITKVEPERAPEIAPVPEPEPEESATPAAAVNVEVFFELGVFELSSDSEASLQEVVEWLQNNPRGKLIIEGHTDPVGSSARNRRLSIKRGKAVRAFLTSAASVPRSRFRLKGYGESKLRYPRNSPKNRRVLVRTR